MNCQTPATGEYLECCPGFDVLYHHTILVEDCCFAAGLLVGECPPAARVDIVQPMFASLSLDVFNVWNGCRFWLLHHIIVHG